MMHETSKVAVITGGSGGMGAATAKLLAESGWRVYILSRRAEDTRGSYGDCENTLCAINCDVSNEESVTQAFSRIADEAGKIDFLFNNAGMGYTVPIQDTTSEMWRETLDTNLTGTFLCCKASLPLLEKSNHPMIMNNASVAAMRAFENFGPYSAAKAGVVAFSNVLREELRAKKIHVCVLCPGATSTGFWENATGEWDRSKMMQPEDIAVIILNVLNLPSRVHFETLTVMPSGGAL